MTGQNNRTVLGLVATPGSFTAGAAGTFTTITGHQRRLDATEI
jgi:hypothetical protein